MRTRPPYAVASVDHALRIAAMLQLEGAVTVAEVAERLGVARSTAHRLLAMLVFRDFAVQDERKVYRAGPVLELAAHSESLTARLRAVSLPHLARAAATLEESANVVVRTGDTVRVIATVECERMIRVGSREGMVFPAERSSSGLLLLAEDPTYVPATRALRDQLDQIRKQGFAVNVERTEEGLVAIGVLIRDPDGTAIAALTLSLPSLRYDKTELPRTVAALQVIARRIEDDLGPGRD